MNIDLALTADAATIDGSGKLNVLGVFDHITVKRFPARHARLALVLRFLGTARDAGDHSLSIQLTSPGGEEMVTLNGEMKLRPGRGSLQTGVRVPHVINLDGLVFKESGIHSFDISVDGRHNATLPLTITVDGRQKGPVPVPVPRRSAMA